MIPNLDLPIQPYVTATDLQAERQCYSFVLFSIVLGIPTLLMLVGILIPVFVPAWVPAVALVIKRFGPFDVFGGWGLLMLAAMGLARRKRKLRCPACDALLGKHCGFVLWTGLCPHCFQRLFVPTTIRDDSAQSVAWRRIGIYVLLGMAATTGLLLWLHHNAGVPIGQSLLGILGLYLACAAQMALAWWADRRTEKKMPAEIHLEPQYPTLLLLQGRTLAKALRRTNGRGLTCLKLYSTPDTWCIIPLGRAELRSGRVAQRVLSELANSKKVFSKVEEFRRREAAFDALDLSDPAWRELAPGAVEIPRASITEWHFTPRVNKKDAAQVGTLTFTAVDGQPAGYLVISPYTPDEVHAVLRGEPIDPTRTVYDPPPVPAASCSSTADRT